MVPRGAISLGTLPVIIGLAAAKIPLRDDMGNMSMTISTSVPDAQRYEKEAGTPFYRLGRRCFLLREDLVFFPFFTRPFVCCLLLSHVGLFQQDEEMLHLHEQSTPPLPSKAMHYVQPYSINSTYNNGCGRDHTNAADPHIKLSPAPAV